MPSILLVDDDVAIRRTLRSLLEGEGYAVHTARNGDEAIEKFDVERPDLVLLDVMMPFRNGFSVCEDIRRRDRLMPVIFLTALNAEAEQVRAFGLGADDFLPKTTGDAEMLARIRRALERAAEIRESRAVVSVVQLGRLTADLDHHCLLDGVDEIDRLTCSEAELLRLLASARGRYFSGEEILAALRGEGYVVEDSAVRSLVSRLKSRLRASGDLLVNKRGLGYALL